MAHTLPEKETEKEVARAFLFACYTGLRWSELKSLNYGNLEDDCLKFRQHNTQDFEYVPLSKTAQDLIGDTRQPEKQPGFQSSFHFLHQKIPEALGGTIQHQEKG